MRKASVRGCSAMLHGGSVSVESEGEGRAAADDGIRAAAGACIANHATAAFRIGCLTAADCAIEDEVCGPATGSCRHEWVYGASE